MAKKGPKYQMGRFTGEMIELMEDPDFDKLELDKGDLVVIFDPQSFKEWQNEILESVNKIECCSKLEK